MTTAERGSMVSIIKSNCHLCGYFCGVRVWVDDHQQIVKIKPDPDRYPYDAAVMAGCRRFAANRELIDHPGRINYPLKRMGKRGDGQWARVSWDQAIAEIASRLASLKDRYGGETLATCISAPHTIYWPLHRYMNLFGSPNNVGIGTVCWNPRIWVNSITYGWPIDDELKPDLTQCVILWGINPAQSDRNLFWKTLVDYAHVGGRIIVIDPRQSETACLATHWLRIKPGTDGILAMGLIHLIIERDLYDRTFVSYWCSGFDELRIRSSLFSPSRVSEITGIPVRIIEETAQLYARPGGPASIFTGLGIDHSGINCTQTLRAIAILRAITGNIDVPGGSLINERSDFTPEVDLELGQMLSPEQRKKKLGPELFQLQRYDGYEQLTRFTMKHGKKLPTRYLTSAHPHLVWQAMLTHDPYPIRAMICMASNPLLSQADTKRIYRALKGLDLLVSLEHFMTPTAMLADFVMPITGSFEQSMIQTNGGVANVAYGGGPAIPPLYERRSDFDFWCQLGKLSGQEAHWPWQTLEQALDDILAPTGQNWEEFCKEGLYAPEPSYYKYLSKGFSTPSGKVELYSTLLKAFSHDPLPSFRTPEKPDETWPLRLITGTRKHPYYSSEFRQINCIRKHHGSPVAEMSGETAKRLGLEQGDEIRIETAKGTIGHLLNLKTMVPNVVSIEYGWWYPEKPAREPELGGLWESNANVLTSSDTALCDPILGQWNFRSIPCRVSKAVKDGFAITLRKGGAGDVDPVTDLLREKDMDYAGPIEDYTLAMKGEEVIGCCRLEDHGTITMIRPIAVKQAFQGHGVGSRLIRYLMPSHKSLALVARGDAADFYKQLGFTPTSWSAIPSKDQIEECRYCPNQQECSPLPMIMIMGRDPASHNNRHDEPEFYPEFAHNK